MGRMMLINEEQPAKALSKILPTCVLDASNIVNDLHVANKSFEIVESSDGK